MNLSSVPANSYVYVLVNSANGKIYVGQTTTSIQTRWADHVKQARLGCQYSLHRAIRKYGSDSFLLSLIVECEGKRNRNALEIDVIKFLNSTDKNVGYNLTAGGEGGAPFSGHKHTADTKKRIGLKQKGIKKPFGHGAKVSAALTGKPKSLKHRANLSGENNGMFGRYGNLNPMFGRKRPDLSAWNRRKRESQ